MDKKLLNFDDIPSQIVEVYKLLPNEGQCLDIGIPPNCRQITAERYKSLLKSIQTNPEMMGLNDFHLYPFGEKYITLSGNMRLKAVQQLGWKYIKAKIVPTHFTPFQIKAIIAKDNEIWGEYDYDELSNYWEIEELQGWDISLPLDFKLDDAHSEDFEVKEKLPTEFIITITTPSAINRDIITKELDKLKIGYNITEK